MRSQATASLNLRVSAVCMEAEDILSLKLAHPSGSSLPDAGPGAHITLQLNGGYLRQYSICNNPITDGFYHIAVKREAESRGGSAAIHSLCEGDTISVRPPTNNFVLDRSASHLILLAGGIGITPLLGMAKDAWSRRQSFEIHYFARDAQYAAFVNLLKESPFSDCVQFHFGVDLGEVWRSFEALLGKAPAKSQLYVCGPAGFIELARSMAKARENLSAVFWESFSSGTRQLSDPAFGHEFKVKLAGTDQVFAVPSEKTVLQVLQENGVTIDSSCMEGVCGLCATRVLEGEPDHRDEVLTDSERREDKLMTVCVSRCKGELIVLEVL